MTPHRHALKTTLALVLAASAIAPAAAAARFDQNPVYVPTPTYAARPAVRVVLVGEGGGFKWGDAMIGAAGGLGLSILGLAGGQVVTRRRDRRAAGSVATPR